MPNEVTVVVTSKDQTDFDSPTKAADRYGDAMGGLGEKADGAEGKLIGAVDTVSGLSTIMQGPGEQGIAAYLQGWADLAGGMATLVFPVLQMVGKQMLTQVANGARFAAATVANAARVVAAWVLMGVQALLGAGRMALAWIIALGPIALVIAAIAAVIAIVVLVVKNWDWLSEKTVAVAKAIGKWIADAAKWVVDAFLGMLAWIAGLPAAIAKRLVNMFAVLGTAFTNGWRWVSEGFWKFVAWVGGWAKYLPLVALFRAMPDAFNAAWRWVSTAWSKFVTWVGGWAKYLSLGGLFGAMATAFNNAWTWVSGNWDKFTKWVGGWKSAFSFSGMFDGISGAFKSAINWVIGKWNNLQFSIPGVDTHIPGVGTIGGFSLGTPNIPYLARGGTARRGGLAVVGERGAEVVDLPGGASVWPMDRLGGGRERVVLELRSSGRRLDDLLVEVLKEAIRIRGGDVQVVLGR